MEHVILVAFTVEAKSRKAAEYILYNRMNNVRAKTQDEVNQHTDIHGGYVTSYWTAEDERYDGSDNDSAVFVPVGAQKQAAEVLSEHIDKWYQS